MIHLCFNITNPLTDRFNNLYCRSGKLPVKHKFWEIQILKSDNIVSFDLQITTRQDHAGIKFWLGLFGYSINFNLYDSRHWDYKTKNWKVYENRT